MRRMTIMLMLALVFAMGVGSGWSEEKKTRGDKGAGSDERVVQLMHEKLKHSQNVLEGLALADYDKISKNAAELVRISNQAGWLVFKTPKYEMYSNEFRRNAETLIADAKEKNLDAAALTYVELTLNCVHCHKYARELRSGRLDRDNPTELRAQRRPAPDQWRRR